MPDKQKRGRIDGRTPDEILAFNVMRDFKTMNSRDRSRHWDRERTGKTVHMILAERYKVPCQKILDIIDPKRDRQAGRIRRWGFRENERKRWELYKELCAPWLVRFKAAQSDEERDVIHAERFVDGVDLISEEVERRIPLTF